MYDVYKFLDNYLNDKDVVVCATSGGVDSMSLLDVLIKSKKNLKIICAHVNHNLRKESFEEYEFVKKYCEDNNIVFEGIVLDKITNGNLESEFRSKRYEFFDKVVNKYNAKYLFTAHHGDDLMETILMRIVRGSSLDGYSGFEMVSERENYTILRPLVYLSKDDIYKYAKDNDIEYREDKTNQSDKYTRNRYRKYILPKLKEENKNVHKKFIKYSEELSGAYTFINNYVKDILDKFYYSDKLDVEIIKSMDSFIVKKVIFEILKDSYKDNIYLISDNNINEILKMIKSSKPNLLIDLPLDKQITKYYDMLEIKTKEDLISYKYEINDEVKLDLGIIKRVDNTNLTNNYVCHLNSNDIKLPIYVRNRKDGDTIEVLGLNGKKKIKDIFIDSKIKKDIRDKYPIVVDSDDNVLWIPGIKKSKYNSLKSKKYDIILWYMKEEDNE